MKNLRMRVFSAVRWTSLSALAQASLQLVQVMVLTRLLNPADYGLMAIVGGILGIAAILSDLGLNSAYIQKRDITSEQRSSLFWANCGVGVLLTIVIAAMSPLFSILFSDARLTPLIALSASVFTLNALGQQIRATAEKNLHFAPVVVVEMISSILNLAVAALLALRGFGVYALAIGAVARSLSFACLSWLTMANHWRPQLRLRLAELKPFASFGAATVVSDLCNGIHRNLDLLIGGRLLPTSDLGLFSVPRNLLLQIQFTVNPIVTRISFPLIAEVQDDREKVRAIYLKTFRMTSAVNAPIYAALAFFATDVIKLLLGDGWQSSAHLLSILAGWGFLRSTVNPVGSLLSGMGRADLEMKWNLALLALIPPFLYLGATYGLEGLCLSQLIISILILFPSWYFLARPMCGITLSEQWTLSQKPTLLALISFGAGFEITNALSDSLLRIIVGASISSATYLLLSILFNREWINELKGFIPSGFFFSREK